MRPRATCLATALLCFFAHSMSRPPLARLRYTGAPQPRRASARFQLSTPPLAPHLLTRLTFLCHHVNQVMAGETQTFDFPSFLEILAKSPQPADAKVDVLAAFKAYDQAGTGTISKGLSGRRRVPYMTRQHDP